MKRYIMITLIKRNLSRMAILKEQIDFRAKTTDRIRGHFTMIKETIRKEDITILTTVAPSNIISKCMKQKGQVDQFKSITSIDRSNRTP